MTANIVTRNHQLIIDGLDCSQCLVQMTGGYSHYGTQPGLIKISGSLTLERSVGWTEDLDDRTNGRWAKGKEISIALADTTGTLKPAPIIGKVYILESEYDGRKTLQIKFGCKFTLLDANTPPGKHVCFPIGEEIDNATIATTLLNKIGITGGFIGSMPGSMFIPPSINNGSYIALLGQICYSQGCICYQGNDGIIRIKPINLSPSPHFTRIVGKHEVEYERLTGVEKPCQKIICSGVKLETQKPNPIDNWHDWNEEYAKAEFYLPNASGECIALREYREEKVNRSTRTISQKHFVWQPKVRLLPRHVDAGLALWYELKEFVDKIYEPSTGEICGIDEGRLKYTQTLCYQPFGLTLAEWVDNNNSHGWTETDLIVAEKIVEDWQYSDGSIPSIDPATGLLSSKPIISYQKLTYLPLGAILPEEDHVIPSSLQLARKEMRSWRKIAENDWEEYHEERESIALADPQVLDRLEEAGRDLTTASKIALAIKKRKPYRSNSGQTHPPAPDRFPADAEVKEILITGETQLPSVFGSEFRARERHYQVDAGLLASEAQAQRIAEIEGAILWGRHKGQAFASPIFDPLFEISPLAAVHWIEPNGKEQKFLLDGAAISVIPRQCVFASDGIWAGLVATHANIPNAIADPPAPDPQDTTEQAIAKPYAKVTAFGTSMAVHGELKIYPYGLSSPPTAIGTGLGMNFLDISNPAPIVEIGTSGAKAGGATGQGTAPIVEIGASGAKAGGATGQGTAPIVEIGASGAKTSGATGQGTTPQITINNN